VAKLSVILYVRDQGRSRDFYRAVLAGEPSLDVPGMTEFSVEGATLGLMPEEGIVRLLGGAIVSPSSSSVPRAEVYLVVDDPEAHHARAVAAGARELAPFSPRDWGHDVSYVADPDEHVIAFARPSRRAPPR
jgi:catechol 2,3-dioxygenase-like lactoylglutathione lyase family enzyme